MKRQGEKLTAYEENGFLYLPEDAAVWSCLLYTSGILKVHQVKEAADFLIEIMPVMFIPAGVGLLESWPALQPVWVPIVLITLLTTVIVMAVTGQVAQKIIRKEQKKNGKVSH